jgi:hypothetical protein
VEAELVEAIFQQELGYNQHLHPAALATMAHLGPLFMVVVVVAQQHPEVKDLIHPLLERSAPAVTACHLH